MFLFGEWVQDGDHFRWWTQLNEVKHFPEEDGAARR
jgi:hypothetical protein